MVAESASTLRVLHYSHVLHFGRILATQYNVSQSLRLSFCIPILLIHNKLLSIVISMNSNTMEQSKGCFFLVLAYIDLKLANSNAFNIARNIYGFFLIWNNNLVHNCIRFVPHYFPYSKFIYFIAIVCLEMHWNWTLLVLQPIFSGCNCVYNTRVIKSVEKIIQIECALLRERTKTKNQFRVNLYFSRWTKLCPAHSLARPKKCGTEKKFFARVRLAHTLIYVLSSQISAKNEQTFEVVNSIWGVFWLASLTLLFS